MEYDVALVDQLADHRGREHGLDDDVEPRTVDQVPDIHLGSGREIVEREYLPALLQQVLRGVRADETGAPGDERLAGWCWHRGSVDVRPDARESLKSLERGRRTVSRGVAVAL